MQATISHRQLDSVLKKLGFVSATVADRWAAYQHCDAEGLIVLPEDRGEEIPAEHEQIEAIRRVVLKSGLIDERGWEALVG